MTEQAPARPLEGRLSLASFEQPVEIRTDRHGVPHVRAQNLADLYRAQGFLHQTERAWQIESNARTALGELAAVLGPAGLASDVLFRKLGLPELCDRAVAEVDRSAEQVFAWYAAGMREAQTVVRTTHEHTALGLPLTVPDARTAHRNAVAISLLIGFSLQHDWILDLVREAITVTGGAAGEHPDAAQVLDAVAGQLGLSVSRTAGSGSNAWAVPGPPGGAGGPIVAGDPHLDAVLPGHFMAMHLTCPELDVIGATVPGLPDVAFGHNGLVGWATTFAPARTTRLVLEKLTDRRTKVLRPRGSAEVVRTTAEIEVRGLGVEKVACEETSNGRLLGFNLRGAEPGTRYDVALRSAQWEAPYDQRALAEMNRAGSLEEFEAGLRRWRSTAQTVVCADRSGRTGLAQSGMRWQDNGESAGIVFGWCTDAVAGGPEARHHLVIGESPVVAANHLPGRGAGGEPESGHWDAPLRAGRIAEMLRAGEGSVSESVRVQLDLRSPLADTLLAELLSCVDRAAQGSVGEAARSLEAWDRQAHRDVPEPVVFGAWLTELARCAAVGTAADQFVSSKAWLTHWGSAVLREWVHERAADEDGRREVAKALERGLAAVERCTGPRPKRGLHREELVYRHRLAGTAFEAAAPHVVGGVVPGADDTVCRGDVGNPAAAGPVWRMVIDLANPDASVWAMQVGNSGVPGSPHFTDWVAPWSRGRFAPMAYSQQAVNRAGGHLLRLLPAVEGRGGPRADS
ncbi:penicillin acylase family protein [Kitasatospora griseola]|uniref:penicillin acylase family protein n=1 Tax=Kitasatospora griseola TaxID=2064 RepID=UPI003431E986